MDYARARFNMVECQIKPVNVTDERLLEAMLTVPREAFVPPTWKGVAYADEDLPLGNGRYLLAPMAAARLIQMARPGEEDLALVVGAGTGYEAIVLSYLASAVVALEGDEEMAAQATRLAAGQGRENVVVQAGPLPQGWPGQAPYDVIIVPGMVDGIPEVLEDQLAEGGRLATIVADEAGIGRGMLFSKFGGVVSGRVEFDETVPRLPGFERERAFVF